MKQTGLAFLKEMTRNPQATFHNDQWECIDLLVKKQSQLLVVQRTGWGKSAVYFIATKIRRMEGFGPTIIISPLLSLIRNQINSAAKLGLSVVSYNSSMTNKDKEISANKIKKKKVDAIIISPEQLGNDFFINNILNIVIDNIGLFVVDEAHCISDWGHDFRPDYRRIVRLLTNMPDNMPVLATTATANNRVVNDIQLQLGERLKIIRGPLTRKSLKLQNINLHSKSERMAWIVEHIENLKGTGIIYAKTIRECNTLTEFLQKQDFNICAYHGNIDSKERLLLESKLLKNEVKALVATSALGMGFDKPDIGFIIHYQAPANLIEYYQQVGRAGRGIDDAIGIMMLGKDDEKIQNYFIENAFPKEDHINQVLKVLEKCENATFSQLESQVNLSKGKLISILKFLSIENPSPIFKDGSKYYRTSFDYKLPYDKIEILKDIKKNEWKTLLDYHQSKQCLMCYLANELDDNSAKKCGKCSNCKPCGTVSTSVKIETISDAKDFLYHHYITFKSRANFATSKANAQIVYPHYKFPYHNKDLLCELGYALSSWRDGSWGDLVADGKLKNKFSNELVVPMVEMLNSITYKNRPTWITYIPSSRHPTLVKEFAYLLAKELDVPCLDAITVNEINRHEPQKQMENSFYQSKNLDGAFDINLTKLSQQPVWLFDDAVDSGWTFMIVGALLKRNGVFSVSPIALTSTKKNG